MGAKEILRSLLCESLETVIPFLLLQWLKYRLTAFQVLKELDAFWLSTSPCIDGPQSWSKNSQFHLENTTIYTLMPSFFPTTPNPIFHILYYRKHDWMAGTKSMKWDINLIEAYKQLRRGSGDLHAKCFYCLLCFWNIIKINRGKWNLLTRRLVNQSSSWPMRLNFSIVLSRHCHYYLIPSCGWRQVLNALIIQP